MTPPPTAVPWFMLFFAAVVFVSTFSTSFELDSSTSSLTCAALLGVCLQERSCRDERKQQQPQGLVMLPTDVLVVVVEGGEISLEEANEFTLLGETMRYEDTREAIKTNTYQDVREAIRMEADPRGIKQVYPEAVVRIVAALGSSSDEANEVAGRGRMYPNVWKFGDDAGLSLVVEQTGTESQKQVDMDVVVFQNNNDRLEAELALLNRMVSVSILHTEAIHASPRLIVAVIGGVPRDQGAARKLALAQLERELGVIASIQARISTRPLMRVVFTRSTHGSTVRRMLDPPLSSRSLQSTTTTTAPFGGFDYVLMSWTLVGLAFIVGFVFLCVPWAPPLDPELTSTIKTGADAKRD